MLTDPGVHRVALVRLRVGLGDLLCSEPALRLLRRARPDLHVTLVTWPEMAQVVDRVGHADELLPFPGAEGIPERTPDPGRWEAFVRRARERRFDLAVQCYGNNPAANRVTAALGARRVGGFAPTGWEPARDPELHLAYPHHLHEVWRHLRLVELLGVPLPAGETRADGARAPEAPAAQARADDAGAPFPVPLRFPIRPDDEAEVAAVLAQHGLEPGTYAVLHPGASSPSRRWPPERFARVGDELAADGLRVVLTGVAGERELVRAVAAAMRAPAIDLAGATTLGGMAALLRAAAVVISNDTGTAHLAAAVEAPSVTAFLPGDPVRWGHPSARHQVARVDVDCNPCPHLLCPIDHRCATAVTPQLVLRRARAALAAGRRTSAVP